ncbi:trypsin-like peptidase domain-containing protein [Nocardioides caldifontis]|uniref:trypsin-like peptidase domain-containing protein n=1 Tax=Nocardioides caldifontis TaxID=2588938 RepID=UPI0011E06EB8|nr:trypsin-like peptidase domain-containing protein [Nocardioides caldifontis]
MRKRLTVAALASAAMLLAPVAASAEETANPSDAGTTASDPDEIKPLQRVSAYVEPSVAYIGIEWSGYVFDRYNKQYLNNGNPFTFSMQCTGYVVNPDGYIATAGHCVDPKEVEATFFQAAAEWAIENNFYDGFWTAEELPELNNYQVRNSQERNGPDRTVTAAWGVSAGGVQTGKALPARVVKMQPFGQGDGAILKVEADNLNALPLSDEDLGVGSEIVALGYPASVDLVTDQTFSPSYKEGAISSEKTVSNGLLKVYEVSAAVSGGMSGGPTVNLEGEVVGFNSFKVNSAVETQQFNFIRPVDTVRELMADTGADNTLSEDTQNYRDGLDAFFDGDKTEAVEKLEAVVDSQPTFELASEYLAKAKDLPDPVDEGSGDDEGGNMGLILGIVGGVVVLALLLGGVLLAMSRRKKGGSPAPAGQYAPVPPAGGPAPTAPYVQGPPAPAPTPLPSGNVPPAPVAPPVPSTPAAPTGFVAPPPAPQAAAAPEAVVRPEDEAPTQTVTSPVVQDTTLFCSNCGTKGEPNQRFCKHCGTAL